MVLEQLRHLLEDTLDALLVFLVVVEYVQEARVLRRVTLEPGLDLGDVSDRMLKSEGLLPAGPFSLRLSLRLKFSLLLRLSCA